MKKTNASTLSRHEIDLLMRGLNLLPNALREQIDEKRKTSERIAMILGFEQNKITEKQEEDQLFELYTEIYAIKNKLTIISCKQDITTEVEFYEN